MTARSTARPLALLIGLAVLVAACAPAATATPGASSPTGATVAPATQAPAGTGGTEPSMVLPSFDLPSGDAALEELLPDDIAGETVQKFSMTGDTFMGTQGNAAMEAVLDQFDKSPTDLSVAFGSTPALALFAYRLKGIDGREFFDAFRTAAGEDAEVTVTDASYGGKAVQIVVSSDPDIGTLYAHTAGEVTFIVGGTSVSDALLTEAFSKFG